MSVQRLENSYVLIFLQNVVIQYIEF